MDVDLTVEEGVQAIVTSGVAIADSELGGGLSGDDLRSLADGVAVDRRTRPSAAVSRDHADDADRTDRYDAAVDPQFADRPRHIVDRERDHDGDPDADRPATQADRAPADRDRTEGRPAARADRAPADRDDTDPPASNGRADGGGE
jgi:hypothetical protein